MKYIIVEDFSGQEIPFIFPRRVDHTDMREQLPYTKVISAGFVELGKDGFICSGGNNELEVHAREGKDAEVLAESFRKR